MGLTSDRNDPRLSKVDERGLQEAYLVDNGEGEFVRPVRYSYKHVGIAGPKYPIRDLSEDEQERYGQYGYVKFEEYPEEEHGLGKYWTQEQLDKIGKGCGVVTTMHQKLSETYARNPNFYGATYCAGCQTHLPVGKGGEFVWVDDDGVTDERVGT
jgi:hypothetical protein